MFHHKPARLSHGGSIKEIRMNLHVPDPAMIAALVVCGFLLHQGVWILAVIEAVVEGVEVSVTLLLFGTMFIALARMRLARSRRHRPGSGAGWRQARQWSMTIVLVALFHHFGFPMLAALLLGSRVLLVALGRCLSANEAFEAELEISPLKSQADQAS